MDHANGTVKGASTERHQIGLAPWDSKKYRKPLRVPLVFLKEVFFFKKGGFVLSN